MPPGPPINGAEQRLDLLLNEIRGLRTELLRLLSPAPESPPDEVRLKEPAVTAPPKPKPKPRGSRE